MNLTGIIPPGATGATVRSVCRAGFPSSRSRGLTMPNVWLANTYCSCGLLVFTLV
jgi:hypothetical protein